MIIVGWLGTALILLCYLALKMNWVKHYSAAYVVGNLLGSAFVGIPALLSGAYSVFTLQAMWILITLVGLIKSFLVKRQKVE